MRLRSCSSETTMTTTWPMRRGRRRDRWVDRRADGRGGRLTEEGLAPTTSSLPVSTLLLSVGLEGHFLGLLFWFLRFHYYFTLFHPSLCHRRRGLDSLLSKIKHSSGGILGFAFSSFSTYKKCLRFSLKTVKRQKKEQME